MSIFYSDTNCHSNNSESLDVITNESIHPSLYSVMNIQEPLFIEESCKERDPIEDKLFELLESTNWPASAVKYDNDKNSWKLMSPDYKKVTEYVLSGFANLEKYIVDDAAEFSNSVKCESVKEFHALKSYNEVVHHQSYKKALNCIARDITHEREMLDAFLTIPAIKTKFEYAKKWFSTDCSVATRIISRTVFEGINFQSSFIWIEYLAQKGFLPGICVLNQYVRRDEGIHTREGAHLVKNRIKYKPSSVVVNLIVSEAVDNEIQFFKDALGDLVFPGITIDMMSETIKSYADQILKDMGYNVLYSANILTPLVSIMATNNKTNFFEQDSTNYSMIKGISATSEDMSNLEF